jgi:hypothetical protein
MSRNREKKDNSDCQCSNPKCKKNAIRNRLTDKQREAGKLGTPKKHGWAILKWGGDGEACAYCQITEFAERAGMERNAYQMMTKNKNAIANGWRDAAEESYYRKEQRAFAAGYTCVEDHAQRNHPWLQFRLSYCENEDGQLGFECLTKKAKEGERLPACILNVHHWQERHNGGSNDPSNLITVCVSCHKIIHTVSYRRLMGDPYAIKKAA